MEFKILAVLCKYLNNVDCVGSFCNNIILRNFEFRFHFLSKTTLTSDLSERSDTGSLHVCLSLITPGSEFLSTFEVNCLIRSPFGVEGSLVMKVIHSWQSDSWF